MPNLIDASVSTQKGRKGNDQHVAVNSIRQQRRDGFSISDIAKMNGVSRDTVYKYLAQDDFSPRPPARRSAPSKLDPYKPVIRQ